MAGQPRPRTAPVPRHRAHARFSARRAAATRPVRTAATSCGGTAPASALRHEGRQPVARVGLPAPVHRAPGQRAVAGEPGGERQQGGRRGQVSSGLRRTRSRQRSTCWPALPGRSRPGHVAHLDRPRARRAAGRPPGSPAGRGRAGSAGPGAGPNDPPDQKARAPHRVGLPPVQDDRLTCLRHGSQRPPPGRCSSGSSPSSEATQGIPARRAPPALSTTASQGQRVRARS